MELLRKYSSEIKKIPIVSNNDIIRLPLSLAVYKRAVKLKIQSELIRNINFIDLQILIFSLEIDNITSYLDQVKKEKLRKKGIKEIRKASKSDFDSL